MATVTALRRLSRPPGRGAAPSTRLAVEVDGEPWLVLEEADVLQLGLHAGCTVDAGLRRRAGAAARTGEAERRALRLLASRGRARAELEARLEPSAGAATARSVVARLERLGVVDDRALAARLAEQRLARGFGPAAIARALADRGIPDALAAATVRDLDPDAVRAAAQRVAAGRDGPSAWRRLAGRGFDEGTIEEVVGAADTLEADELDDQG